MQTAARQTASAARQVLTKAVVNAAHHLKLNQNALAEILGLSKSSVSRMQSGAYLLDEHRKEWEHGLLFVRLFRSLDAIVGAQAPQWLAGDNLALNGRPADLLRSTEGLVNVVHYLDAHRGRI